MTSRSAALSSWFARGRSLAPWGRVRSLVVSVAPVAFVALGLAACSSTSADPTGDDAGTSGRAANESHGSEQANGRCRAEPETLRGSVAQGGACATFSDCAPVCCACATKQAAQGFTATACVAGTCASAELACALAKKADYCPADPLPADAGPSPTGDAGAQPNPSGASFCVPYTASHATDRAAGRVAQTAQLVNSLTVAPGSGSINVTRNAAGKPTYISYAGSGAIQGYTVSLTYDSSGNLTYMRRSYSGSMPSDTHSLTYDAKNNLTYYRLSFSDSQPSQTESLTFDSGNRLSYYRQSFSDSQPSTTETLSYDAEGYLTSWRRSFSSSKPSETETFSYDSDKRLSSWRRSYSDSTPTESASMSYSGASRVPSSIRTDGASLGGAVVLDCKK